MLDFLEDRLAKDMAFFSFPSFFRRSTVFPYPYIVIIIIFVRYLFFFASWESTGFIWGCLRNRHGIIGSFWILSYFGIRLLKYIK